MLKSDKKISFHFRWGFFLFCLVFVILFIQLGFWQLHRYHFKKNLLTKQKQSETIKPMSLQAVTNPVAFQAVYGKGVYQSAQTLVVQNRFYHDKVGFEVYTPMKMDNDDKWLLVDRGWVENLTTINTENLPQHSITIKGNIKLLNEYQFILGPNILKADKAPFIVQKIKMNEIEKLLQHAFYPFVLQLNPNEPNGFIREWSLTTITPERHLGYAIQWFLLSLVVSIAFLCFCLERGHDANRK